MIALTACPDSLFYPSEDSVFRSRWMTILAIVLSLAVGAIVVFTVRQFNRVLEQSVTELAEGAEQVANAAAQVSSSCVTRSASGATIAMAASSKSCRMDS